MTLQRDVLHGGISRLWQTSIMVYKDFALVTDYGYGVFCLYIWWRYIDAVVQQYIMRNVKVIMFMCTCAEKRKRGGGIWKK